MRKIATTTLLFTCVLFAPALFGQSESAEVLGTVHDNTGGVVPKARVTLTQPETGSEAKTITDDDGYYDFFNVKIGRYTVAVEAPGFTKFTTTDVTVTVNARQRVDVTLQLGAVTETVEVNGVAAALETDSSQHGQVINTQQIAELPLNGRSYADLALLSTNTHRSPMAALFSPSGTPREGAININGMRSTYNNFLLDGLDNNAYSPSNQGYASEVVQPSPDALSEFRVLTSNFSAEYGRVGGGVINAAMRSGTNQYHASAWEFLRNTDLNAVGFFKPTGGVKPTLHRNQFGASIGGPIVKNKLFFFGDYEGFRQVQSYLNFDTIPTLDQRNGILKDDVRNPLTGVLYPAGTQIPIAQLSPFAASVLTNLPAPTSAAASSNFQALLPIRDYSDKYDAKVDGQINDHMSAFLRFSQRKDLQYFGPDLPGPSGGGGNGYIHAIQQQAAAGYTWTVTPSQLFDARFGFTHVLGGKNPPYLGGPSMLALYGISGLPTDPSLTGGLNTQSVSNFSAFGRQGTNPQFQNPTSFNPKFSYSWLKGRHSIKAGYEFVAVRTEVLDINPLYGSDTYSGQFSKPVGAATTSTGPSSWDLADFIFGLPSTIQLGNKLVTNTRQHVHSVYLQDDYRVTPKLTLNLGVRWEFATPLWERDNLWANFDPASNRLVQATDGSLFNRTLVNSDHKDIGPRVGFAYSVTPKTVVRGGYGISYSFFNRPGSGQEGINGPAAIYGTIVQSIPAGGAVPPSFLTTQNSFTTGLTAPGNFNPLTNNIDYIPSDTKWPYVQNWLFSVQQELFKNTILELAYNGNHALRLPVIGDYNQAVPNQPGGTLGVQARRPDQSFGPITFIDPAGSNTYNGLSARFEHRFGGGLYFLNSFTWSKALGNSEQALESFPGYTVANPQNIHNLAGERGPTSFDVEFMNVTSVVYDLPFGKGRKFGAKWNSLYDSLLGGWELNTINTANSGNAINVYYSPSSANDVTGLTQDWRGAAFLRPNVSGSGISQSTAAMIDHYFAGYTFTTPPVNAPFGNLGRNAFRAPGLEQWDLGADKTFRLPREGMGLQFRAEFFNVLNHTNFGVPVNVSTSGAFGQIRSTYAPRQVQFGLKLNF